LAARVPEDFLISVALEFEGPGTVAVALGGSQVMGRATRHSDVDFLVVPRTVDERPTERYRYIDGRLISVALRTFDSLHASLNVPVRAIYMLPALRDSRALIDHDGEFRRFQDEIRHFSFEPLQSAGRQHVIDVLQGQTETVHKLLSALDQPSRLKVFDLAHARSSLILNLTEALAIDRSILAEGGDLAPNVISSLGPSAPWAHFHERAWSAADPGETASASLRLYAETVQLVWSSLPEATLALVRQTVHIIDEALA
jgi:predicted nucleotidyltransferase